MATKLYVGNLSYSVGEEELKELFAPFGEMESVTVIMDRDSGRSKGFGFVEMAVHEQAIAAIRALDGKEMDGRQIKVNEARPREARPAGRGGGGGGFRGRR
ncbi:MAG: RNA-binding protein [Armatimonadetes bacterium]|nr:RNA-binding protein [Armatimonadota bacterium]